ncbi:uncharacterized protein LOC131326822 [Rhododendron vialii]|uniref:uncharacterized protein LOC131326822 n=1 Tax=Rhododendron vialii TaxID=182163 RepID=UPI00265FBAEB|nr:uncharacterized protein LOC131326822 [Rhododendron vialii]
MGKGGCSLDAGHRERVPQDPSGTPLQLHYPPAVPAPAVPPHGQARAAPRGKTFQKELRKRPDEGPAQKRGRQEEEEEEEERSPFSSGSDDSANDPGYKKDLREREDEDDDEDLFDD